MLLINDHRKLTFYKRQYFKHILIHLCINYIRYKGRDKSRNRETTNLRYVFMPHKTLAKCSHLNGQTVLQVSEEGAIL